MQNQVTCPGMVFSKSVKLTSHAFPKENPRLPLPLSVRFDDGSFVLIKTPITVSYPEQSRTSNTQLSSVPLHAVIAWARMIYLSLWKIPALDWFHSADDAIIDSLFKNPGEVAWRLGFSF